MAVAVQVRDEVTVRLPITLRSPGSGSRTVAVLAWRPLPRALHEVGAAGPRGPANRLTQPLTPCRAGGRRKKVRLVADTADGVPR